MFINIFILKEIKSRLLESVSKLFLSVLLICEIKTPRNYLLRLLVFLTWIHNFSYLPLSTFSSFDHTNAYESLWKCMVCSCLHTPTLFLFSRHAHSRIYHNSEKMLLPLDFELSHIELLSRPSILPSPFQTPTNKILNPS